MGRAWGCGLEAERAKALLAKLLSGGPAQEFCSGMEQVAASRLRRRRAFFVAKLSGGM